MDFEGHPVSPDVLTRAAYKLAGTLSVTVQRGRGGPGMLRGRRVRSRGHPGRRRRASGAGPGAGLLFAQPGPQQRQRDCALALLDTAERPRNVCTPHRRSVELEAVARLPGRPGKRSPVGHKEEPRGPWVGRTSEEACVLVQAGEGGTHTQNQGEE